MVKDALLSCKRASFES